MQFLRKILICSFFKKSLDINLENWKIKYKDKEEKQKLVFISVPLCHYFRKT